MKIPLHGLFAKFGFGKKTLSKKDEERVRLELEIMHEEALAKEKDKGISLETYKKIGKL